MNKILIVPDSFKGTMTSSQVCDIIENTIKEYDPSIETLPLPIADGGEGTLDCIKRALGWQEMHTEVKGPFGDMISASYLISCDETKTAIIEAAQAIGLELAANHLDPCTASSYGVGTLIKDAILRGYTNIIIGLGGSCTNDCGAGAAAALGTKFYDSLGNEFIPVGSTLEKVVNIDNSICEELLKNCSITAMCDVVNPLYGPNGAASVFAPQKGADLEMVAVLDYNLKVFSNTIDNILHKSVANIPGSGACGGLGAGVIAFMQGELTSGIDTLLDIVGFDTLAQDCDLIITGEGRLDSQSLKGKAVVGISHRVKNLGKNIPVVAFVGSNRLDYQTAKEHGISNIIPTTPTYMLYEEARRTCFANLKNAVTKYIITSGL
ncbi:MAG: glycerate kinase [Lachnospiraceae bacterium]|nr:glycerate kinase [Lachnospiraceae bacterium]